MGNSFNFANLKLEVHDIGGIYDSIVTRSTSSINEGMGTNINPLLLGIVYVSILLSGLGYVISRILFHVKSGKKERKFDRIRSNLLTVVLPWITSDLDIEPEQLFCSPTMYLKYSDYQVLGLSRRVDKDSNRLFSLLTMKTLYNVDKESMNFPKMEDYKIYHSNYTNEDIDALILHILGKDRVISLPSDVTSIVSLFLFKPDFRALGPRVEIFTLPPIGEWHGKELETLYFMRYLLKILESLGIPVRLDIVTRRELFNLILHSQDFVKKYAFKKYNFGVIMKPSSSLAKRIFKLLIEKITPTQLLAFDIVPLPNLSSVDEDKDWIDEFRRICRDRTISDYLSAEEYDRLSKEMIVFPFLLNEVETLREKVDGSCYDGYGLERVFSKFSKRTIVLTTPHSEKRKVGFLYTRDVPENYEGKSVENQELRKYVRRDYMNHSVNQDKLRYGPPIVNPFSFDPWAFMNDRLSFDNDVVRLGSMLKRDIFPNSSPADLKHLLRFMRYGTGVFNGLCEFESREFGTGGNNEQYIFLTGNMLYEVTSFWNFDTSEYLLREKSIYRSMLRPLRSHNDYPLMQEYLHCLLPITNLSNSKGNGFCLRRLGIDTARKIILNTQPDIGTFIRTNRYFIQLGSDDYAALDAYSPDKETDYLLEHWAKHGLCNFKWHGFYMSKILRFKDAEEKYDPDKVRLNFLHSVMRGPLSKDMELYVRIYASVALLTNLAQQMIQINLSSGLAIRTWAVDPSAPSGEKGVYRNIIYLPGPNDTNLNSPFYRYEGFRGYVRYDKISKGRENFLKKYLNYEPVINRDNEINEYIRNMLTMQGRVISEYGTQPYTYGPGISNQPVTGSTYLTKENTVIDSEEIGGNLTEYELTNSTLLGDDHNGRDYDMDSLEGSEDTE